MRTLLGILAIVCWVQSVFAESEQLRFSFESLEDSIVTVNVLENGRSVDSGSGFVVQSDRYNGYVVTSAGLIGEGDSVMVTAPEGGATVASVTRVDAGIDVAVLKVNGLRANPVTFSLAGPVVGDAVWSAGRFRRDGSSLSVAKGHLINLSQPTSNGIGILAHTATLENEGPGSILVNECGELVGLGAGRSGAGARALDVIGLKRVLSELNVRTSVASSRCFSEVLVARQEAERASEQAARASQEAARAQDVARDLETRLKASDQRNVALESEARAARRIADEAIRAAESAQDKAEETRLELERKVAAITAETEAMLKYMERDRVASEERFREALETQADQAAQRETILVIATLLVLVAVIAGFFMVRGRGQMQPAASARSKAGQSVEGGSGRTEMHKQELTEYVLDGRDENGIRYLLRISGDQLVNPDGVIIGRNPEDSPYIINHADVSRRHARMKVMKNRVFIEDLGSTNGTSVNGQSIDEKGAVAVDSGDQIIIGSVVMKLRVLDA
jgi:hypothetical protein